MYRLYCNNGKVLEFNRKDFWFYLKDHGQSIDFEKCNKKFKKLMKDEGSDYMFYTKYKTMYAVQR